MYVVDSAVGLIETWDVFKFIPVFTFLIVASD